MLRTTLEPSKRSAFVSAASPRLYTYRVNTEQRTASLNIYLEGHSNDAN